MNKMNVDCIVPKSSKIESNVIFGSRVLLAGDGIVVRANVRLDAGCIIAEGLTIGQGAWVRPGAVVLQSVPANAIVEGNPAVVVGYVNRNSFDLRPKPRLIDVLSYRNFARPSKIPLNVGDSVLYLMRRIVDGRGSLTVGEVPSEVPFIPARYFAVYGVPSIELRGEHAHKQCKQFLICLHGSCRVLIDDGESRCELLLDRADIGVFMPEMIWGTQYRFSPDAVLLVFASRPYEDDDYLRSYEDFIAESQRVNLNKNKVFDNENPFS
jgi:hypothetical protein